jgi:hypothetical protein
MGIMSRPPGQPAHTPPVSAAPLPPVIPGETCDRCGAAPRHRVYIPYTHESGYTASRQLLFCQHHFDKYQVAIAAAGYRVS